MHLDPKIRDWGVGAGHIPHARIRLRTDHRKTDDGLDLGSPRSC